jgi:hypothetical protein
VKVGRLKGGNVPQPKGMMAYDLKDWLWVCVSVVVNEELQFALMQ